MTNLFLATREALATVGLIPSATNLRSGGGSEWDSAILGLYGCDLSIFRSNEDHLFKVVMTTSEDEHTICETEDPEEAVMEFVCEVVRWCLGKRRGSG